MRYDESPVSLAIASIATEYEATLGAEARPFFSSDANNGLFRSVSAVLPAASGSVSNRPTIGLVPSHDGSSVRRFLTPISAETLVFLTQTSWPVSTVLRLYVERLNGVPNAVSASGPPRPILTESERFLRVADLFQSLQDREWWTVGTTERTTVQGGSMPAGQVTPQVVLDAAKSGYEYWPVGPGATWELVKRERR